MKDILLIVNSDFGRGNTIGARFAHIADELERQGKTFDIIARANYTDRQVYTPWYRNSIVRVLNAVRIYVFPTLDVRSFDIRVFDRYAHKQVRRLNCQYRVAHVGDSLPKVLSILKMLGVHNFLDVPIGHPAYSKHLAEQGIVVGAKFDSGEEFIAPSMKFVDQLIVPSQFVVDTLYFAGILKKYSIIPFGVDISDTISKKVHHEDLPVKFLFVGAVNMRKGIPYLLEAWRGIKGAELTLCGRVYKEVQDLIDIAPHTVTCTGFVNPADYFNQADVFVFPTLLEGSSKAVYEAMSYGLPVITTANAGSIIEDGKTGFIIPIADVDVLREKIQYFIDHKNEVTCMGNASRTVVSAYTWKKYATSVIQLYKL